MDVAYTRWLPGESSDKIKPWNWMTSLAHGGGALNNFLTHQLGMLERMTGQKIISAVGEARRSVRKSPVLPEIHDYREWMRKDITAEEASNLEWIESDAEWVYSAIFKMG